MIISIDPERPEGRKVHQVAQILRRDGVIALPTDTVYAFACDVQSRKAVERMRALRALPRNKLFSLLFSDLSEVGAWAGYLPPYAYRAMRRILPGPYTFILEAADSVPKRMHSKRRTIGVRVPDCPIVAAVVRELGRPLACTSVPAEDDDPLGDPEDLERRFGRELDAVVDGGVLVHEPSTVIDLTGGEPEVVRVGKGDVSLFEAG